jgi:hypothetical protein
MTQLRPLEWLIVTIWPYWDGVGPLARPDGQM